MIDKSKDQKGTKPERYDPNERFYGCIIPNSLIERKDFTMTDKVLFARMIRFSFQYGYCWPSIAKMAKSIGCSTRAIQTSIKHLEASGLIEIEHNMNPKKGHINNVYYFIENPILNDKPKEMQYPPKVQKTTDDNEDPYSEVFADDE